MTGVIYELTWSSRIWL